MSSTISSDSTTVAKTLTPRITVPSEDATDVSDHDLSCSTVTNAGEDDGSTENGNTTYQLKLTNMALLKEIAQLKTDKEFVWSLWKRLQVANPNISAAMDVVVAREREKAELKDQKVLRILAVKDEQINKLQTEFDDVSAILETVKKSSADMVAVLDEERAKNARELAWRDDEITTLKASIEKLEKEMTEREKTLTSESDVVKNKLVKAREEVKSLAERESDHTRMADELRITLEDEKKKIGQLTTEVSDLRLQLNEAHEKDKKIKTSYSEAKALLQAFGDQRHKDKKLAEQKEAELESVRLELVHIWEKHKVEEEKSASLQNIVTQLQKLQSNTQNVIKNQEVVFEADANHLKVNFEKLKAEMKLKLDGAAADRSRLEKENVGLKEKVETLSRIGKDKETQARIVGCDQFGQVNEAVLECEFEMMQLKREQSALKAKLEQKNELIEKMEAEFPIDKESLRPVTVQPSAPKSKLTKKHHDNLNQLSAKLHECQKLVEAKQGLIDALEKVHDSRAKRMKEAMGQMAEFSTGALTEMLNTDPVKLSGKVKEIVFLRHENLKATKENLDLREKNDELLVKIASKDVLVKSHSFEVDQLKAEIARTKADADQLAVNNDDLKRSEKELRKKLGTVESELKVSQKELKTSYADCDRLGMELRRTEQRARDLQQSENQINFEVTQLRIRASESQKDLNRAKTMLENERTKVSELNETIRDLHRQMAEIEREWKRKWEDADRAHQLAIKETDIVGSSSTDDVTAESDAETLKNLKDSFQSAAAQAIAVNKRARNMPSKQRAILRNRLVGLKKTVAALTNERNNLKIKCAELQNAATDAGGRLNAEMTKAAEVIASKERELAKVMGDLRRSEMQERETSKAQQEIVKSADFLRSELTRQKNLVKNSQDCRTKVEADLDTVTGKLKAAEKDNARKKALVDEYKEKIQCLVAEKEERAKVLCGTEDKKAGLELGMKSLKKSNEALKLKMDKLLEDVAAKDKEIKECRDKFRAKEKELKKTSKKLKESDGSLTELEQVAKREMESLVETSETQLLSMQHQVSLANGSLQLLKEEVMEFARFLIETQQEKAAESIRVSRQSPLLAAEPDEGLSAAKNTAKQILQLSDDDIDEIMSCLSPSGQRVRRSEHSILSDLRARCATWLAAVQKSVDAEDAGALRNLHALLMGKTMEVTGSDKCDLVA